MEENKLAKLTEILYINMFGEGSRNSNIINIGSFSPDSINGKVCLRIAQSVSGLFGYKIKLGCSLFSYIKFLIKEKKLFKNKFYIWDRKNSGRSALKWLSDISNAYGEDINIWNKVWEYLNNSNEKLD